MAQNTVYPDDCFRAWRRLCLAAGWSALSAGWTGSWCCSSLLCFYWFYVYFMSVKSWEKSVEISNYDCGLSMYPFRYIVFCYVYFEALLLSAHIFNTLFSLDELTPFIIIKYCSYSWKYFLPWNLTCLITIEPHKQSFYSYLHGISFYNLLPIPYLCLYT